LLMYPAGQIEEAIAKGIGTGLYQVVNFDPGVRLITKRVKDHYKGDSAGHFDEVEIIAINDGSARMNALMTGQVDVVSRVDFKTETLLKANPNTEIFEVTGNQHFSFPMLSKTAPFDDNNIRLALKHSLDREAMLQTILRGHGYIGNDHPIGKSNRYFAAELEQKSYDPDKARHYLKKAGRTNLEVDLSAADAAFGGAVDAAVLFKEHAAAAGITINVVREPNDGYWSNIWNTDNRKWCMCYWGGRPTEDWMFATAYAAGADWNDSFWTHEKFNKLLLQARSELDDAKRRQMYFEMQQIVSDEGAVLVPMFNNYVFATNDKVGHADVMGANWGMDGNRGMERWWFKS